MLTAVINRISIVTNCFNLRKKLTNTMNIQVDPSWQQEVFQFHSLASVEAMASEKPVDLAWAMCQSMSASSPAAEEAFSEQSWCPGPSAEVVEIG